MLNNNNLLICIILCLTVMTAALAAIFDDTDQCRNGPCGPGNDQCKRPDLGRDFPQFHVRDTSCSVNDPNFPFYDPVNKLYHSFYQLHIYQSHPGAEGPVIGHSVSADLIKWAHLPVAVWNDQPYDNVAIWSGSTTMVNGIPTMIYPGLCSTASWSNCVTGTNFAIAVPANMSDPFLTNWSKPSYNPIVQNVQRDPSTAWRTASGEWRFTNYQGLVWVSDDFVSWKQSSNKDPIFPADAECPDFFPLPKVCTGCGGEGAVVGNGNITHVHKHSSAPLERYLLGSYSDGEPGSSGVWTPIGGEHNLDQSVVGQLPGGFSYYASKGFHDPVKDRTVYWGWANIGDIWTQSLPREVTYDPRFQFLVFSPVEELDQLRAAALVPKTTTAPPLRSGETRWMGNFAGNAGNQSEVSVTFTLPTAPSVFGVEVLVGELSGVPGVNSSVPVLFTYDSSNHSLAVSIVRDHTPMYTSVQKADIPGSDYANSTHSSPEQCRAACEADVSKPCRAWTFVSSSSTCFFKDWRIDSFAPNDDCTSGYASGQRTPMVPVPLLASEKEVEVRVYVDNTVVEVYVQGGRLALTRGAMYGQALSSPTAGGVNLVSRGGGDVSVSSVEMWSMESIWVTPEEVLKRRKQ
eukprot:PhM_4_TR14035/c0_g1_i1/m.98143/K01193/INV, sacA; beta-fructofuranosidase